MPSKRYKDLGDLMKRKKDIWVACEGMEVIQLKSEKPIDYSKPYLAQRRYWLKNTSYNKIILSRVPLDWVPGLHRLSDIDEDESRAIACTGLYLVHLKHADMRAVGRDLNLRQYPIDAIVKDHEPSDRLVIPERIKKFL